MKNFAAIFKKQLKDVLKNKAALIQFVLFPLLTAVLTTTVKPVEMPENFFVSLFSTMYVGMAPLSCAAALISEEKEKGTLRVLLMSGVKPQEFLAGTGGFIFAACMAGSAVMCAIGGYSGRSAAIFTAVMAAGIIISLTIGGTIGLLSPSQSAANSIAIPLMLLLSLLPMLSVFNETVAKVSKVLFSEQIRQCLQGQTVQISAQAGIVAAVNMFVITAVFAGAYCRNKGRL